MTSHDPHGGGCLARGEAVSISDGDRKDLCPDGNEKWSVLVDVIRLCLSR